MHENRVRSRKVFSVVERVHGRRKYMGKEKESKEFAFLHF